MRKIAVVDDNADNRLIIRTILEDQYEIVEFSAGRGRVILFAAGWQPVDSQFARSSKFPMLMYRLLEYAAGSTPRPERWSGTCGAA